MSAPHGAGKSGHAASSGDLWESSYIVGVTHVVISAWWRCTDLQTAPAGSALSPSVSLNGGRNTTPERFRVPAATARLVNAVHSWHGRVIAVGTTVMRALETVAAADGTVSEGRGWTSLVITAEGRIVAVDGLLTGWHEREASHLQLLEAAAGRELLDRSYRAAIACGYCWHEFGDVHLILP